MFWGWLRQFCSWFSTFGLPRLITETPKIFGCSFIPFWRSTLSELGGSQPSPQLFSFLDVFSCLDSAISPTKRFVTSSRI